MGPLTGIKIVELAGIGPGPFAGMMLADMGAEVVVIERPGGGLRTGIGAVDVTRRGKRSLEADLKTDDGRAAALAEIATADALIEGYRPGVAERLGLGPAECWARNPRLVFGRITGWGQEGPMAQSAGHDLNYIALAGVLGSMGPSDREPAVPLNLIGDYGGGGMLLAFGVVCAILEARTSGEGQVVDAAMVDGAAIMTALFHGLRASGGWSEARGRNFLDGGAHYYRAYRTRDDQFVTLGAIEKKFMATFIERAGLDPSWLDRHDDPAAWPELSDALETLFASKDLEDWRALLEGTDACFAPAPPFWEAHRHPHNRARGAFIEIDGVVQPAPAPRFSRTRPTLADAPRPAVPKDD